MNIRNKRIIVYIAYCVVVVVLVIVIALIYRPKHPDVATSHHSTTHQPAGTVAGKGGGHLAISNTPVSGNRTITNTTTARPAQGTSVASPAAAPAAPNGTLNNTGPGNIFGLFTLVSVLGAWLYRRKLIRSVIR